MGLVILVAGITLQAASLSADNQRSVTVAEGSSNDPISEEYLRNLLRRDHFDVYIETTPFLVARVPESQATAARRLLIGEARHVFMPLAIDQQPSVDQRPAPMKQVDPAPHDIETWRPKDRLLVSAAEFLRLGAVSRVWTTVARVETQKRQYLNRGGTYSEGVELRIQCLTRLPKGRVQGPVLVIQVWDGGSQTRQLNRLPGEGLVGYVDPLDELTKLHLSGLLSASNTTIMWDGGEFYSSQPRQARKTVREDARDANYAACLGRHSEEVFTPDSLALRAVRITSDRSRLAGWLLQVLNWFDARGTPIRSSATVVYQRRRYLLPAKPQSHAYDFWVFTPEENEPARILQGQTWDGHVRLWPVGQNSLLTTAWGRAAIEKRALAAAGG